MIIFKMWVGAAQVSVFLTFLLKPETDMQNLDLIGGALSGVGLRLFLLYKGDLYFADPTPQILFTQSL